MAAVELHQALRRQHAPHLLLEVVPVLLAEVVEDEESALGQVGAQALGFGVGQRPEARLRHVGDRVAVQLGVVEREDVAVVEVRAQQRDLLQDLHQVAIGARVVVRPRRLAAEAAEAAAPAGQFVAQPHEGEPAVVGRRDLVESSGAGRGAGRARRETATLRTASATAGRHRRHREPSARDRRAPRLREADGTPVPPFRAEQAQQQQQHRSARSTARALRRW